MGCACNGPRCPTGGPYELYAVAASEPRAASSNMRTRALPASGSTGCAGRHSHEQVHSIQPEQLALACAKPTASEATFNLNTRGIHSVLAAFRLAGFRVSTNLSVHGSIDRLAIVESVEKASSLLNAQRLSAIHVNNTPLLQLPCCNAKMWRVSK